MSRPSVQVSTTPTSWTGPELTAQQRVGTLIAGLSAANDAAEKAVPRSASDDRLTALKDRQAAMNVLASDQQWFLLISLVNGLMYDLTELDPEGALERHRKALAYSVRQELATRPSGGLR